MDVPTGRAAGKLFSPVWTPSLYWASNQSPEVALCLSGHFGGEKSKSKEQGSQRTEKMWIKCQRMPKVLQGGNISRHLGAGPSVFIGFPILHAGYGQGDSHTLLFLASPSLFLSKMNLKELTENFKLPEEQESGEAPVETTTHMD